MALHHPADSGPEPPSGRITPGKPPSRQLDAWGSPLGCGRPLRPACPRAGICEGCEHAGLGGRRSPRGYPTRLFTSRWRPRPSFKLSAICGLPLCGAGFSQALARPFRSGSTARQANQWLWQEKGYDHLAPNSPEFGRIENVVKHVEILPHKFMAGVVHVRRRSLPPVPAPLRPPATWLRAPPSGRTLVFISRSPGLRTVYIHAGYRGRPRSFPTDMLLQTSDNLEIRRISASYAEHGTKFMASRDDFEQAN